MQTASLWDCLGEWIDQVINSGDITYGVDFAKEFWPIDVFWGKSAWGVKNCMFFKLNMISEKALRRFFADRSIFQQKDHSKMSMALFLLIKQVRDLKWLRISVQAWFKDKDRWKP